MKKETYFPKKIVINNKKIIEDSNIVTVNYNTLKNVIQDPTLRSSNIKVYISYPEMADDILFVEALNYEESEETLYLFTDLMNYYDWVEQL